MIKRIVLLFLFFLYFSFPLFAQEELPLISDISLINSNTSGLNPPAKLMIGVDMERDAYYKLSDKENTIKGGLFKRGLNIISIEADDLFQKSGSRIYFLDFKANDLMLRKEIEIDIQLDSHEIVKKTDDKRENQEFELSMFIGDKLILTSKKLPQITPSVKLEFPPWPDTYKPHNPIERVNSPLNSFSIFDAVGVAYDLIKKLVSKKSEEKEVNPIQMQKQMKATFLRKNSEGASEEVRAVITLKTRDLKIPF